jgi:hypothetical protein
MASASPQSLLFSLIYMYTYKYSHTWHVMSICVDKDTSWGVINSIQKVSKRNEKWGGLYIYITSLSHFALIHTHTHIKNNIQLLHISTTELEGEELLGLDALPIKR